MKSKDANFITMNMTMWWAMEPWYEYGGGSIAMGLYPSRINNKCRPVILVP